MQPIKISKVRSYRQALGKTQKEMSELLNIHHVVYGRKERMLVSFTDKEKVKLLNYLKEYFPNETIDSLFF
jgi:putative DNA-binding phage protein